MGKRSGKKKKQAGRTKTGNSNAKQNKDGGHTPNSSNGKQNKDGDHTPHSSNGKQNKDGDHTPNSSNVKQNKDGDHTPNSSNVKQNKDGDHTPNSLKRYDKDAAAFISMSQELKDEGNKLFQRRDYEGAMLKYDKALKLLPRGHIDVAYLRSNTAACFMQLGLTEYPRAIHECNLALEVSPKYTKALLKRARCYEGLNRLDLALRDVNSVLNIEVNNFMALEIAERIKLAIEEKGIIKDDDMNINLGTNYVEPEIEVVMDKRKKKKNKAEEKKAEDKENISNRVEEKKAKDKEKINNEVEEKKAEDKVVVEQEKISNVNKEESKKMVKLVFKDDIRWAHIPINCSLLQLREAIRVQFPRSKAVLVKYKDQEGDLITITTDEELKWAEASANQKGSVKLHIVEVNPDQDLFYDRLHNEKMLTKPDVKQSKVVKNGREEGGKEIQKVASYIDDWIIRFAQLFKNHVGLDSDSCLNFHELGVELYTEAMEETVTSDEAQGLFDLAEDNFQEMAALALFNWGNVHMSRARKQVFFTDDTSRESLLAQVRSAYDWAQKEYVKAGMRYKAAMEIKPGFYEGLLALGQQQFEQARLSWYYAIGSNFDLETWASTEVLPLYNNAEDNMERGMQILDELEQQHVNELSKMSKNEARLPKMDLVGICESISTNEEVERAENMKSQINLLWGTMLYERSIVEFKLEIPLWQECLEVSAEKFELAGASPTDIAVMIKNHCYYNNNNNNTAEGFGFKIDEIVQAWNEMYEARRWQNGVSSFHLEPLFRRRVPQVFHALEHP